MRKGSKLLILILILIGIVYLVTKVTSAWLTDEKDNSISMQVGKVEYTIDPGTFPSDFVVGGQQIVDGLKITNLSTVNSEFRIQIKYTISNTLIQNGTYYVNLTEVSSGIFDVSKTAETWTYNLIDNFNYFNSTTLDKTLIDTLSMTLNGNKLTNDFTNGNMQIDILLQAKQADYITWDDCASANINFKTGASNLP